MWIILESNVSIIFMVYICESIILLVGGIRTPLKNMKVNWDDYSKPPIILEYFRHNKHSQQQHAPTSAADLFSPWPSLLRHHRTPWKPLSRTHSPVDSSIWAVIPWEIPGRKGTKRTQQVHLVQHRVFQIELRTWVPKSMPTYSWTDSQTWPGMQSEFLVWLWSWFYGELVKIGCTHEAWLAFAFHYWVY